MWGLMLVITRVPESIIVSTLTLLLERLVVPIAPPERVSSLAQSTEVKGDALRHLHPGQRHKEQPFERPGVAPAIVELVPILAEEKGTDMYADCRHPVRHNNLSPFLEIFTLPSRRATSNFFWARRWREIVWIAFCRCRC